ncbi:MAG: oxidoreductase, partial [Ruminococcus sp.]|nr:oxidoreductase [Ruminococcus sp.]
VNADSFELALALTENGFRVSEIYGTVGERNFFYIKKLAELSPDTRIFTNLSPTMLNYERRTQIDVTIGVDAGYYHPDLPNVMFNDEEQPFGYVGVTLLMEQLSAAAEKEGK